MKRLLLQLGILLAGLFPLACGSNNSPATPSASTSTPTITQTPTPTSAIAWSNAQVGYYNFYGGSGGSSSYLDLEVNGQAVSTAGVTLSGSFSGAPIPLPYYGPTTTSGKVWGDYSPTIGFSYQEGQTYIMTTVTSAGTAAATLTAPAIVYYSWDSNGAVTLAQWNGTGNAGMFGSLSVSEQTPTNFTTFSAGVSTNLFVAIPGTAYPGGSGSTYTVFTQNIKSTTGQNLDPNHNGFTIYSDASKDVVLP